MLPLNSSQTLDPKQLLGILNVLGDVLWIVAYVLTIRKGFQDRTYGIPMLCIALNLSWEFIYAAIFPFKQSMIIELLRWAWFILDLVIAYQLFRYGRAWQSTPLTRRFFYPVAIATFISTFVGQLTYHYTLGDPWGITNAYLINLVMSVLFVWMCLHRPGEKGLSIGAAWAKMLGTGVLSLGSCLMITDWLKSSFMVYLYVTIFIFDALYIILLYDDKRQRASQTRIGAPVPSSVALK